MKTQTLLQYLKYDNFEQMLCIVEAHSESCQTSNMERFTKAVSYFRKNLYTFCEPWVVVIKNFMQKV